MFFGLLPGLALSVELRALAVDVHLLLGGGHVDHGRLQVRIEVGEVDPIGAEQFQRARNELTRDRIIRVLGVDQTGDRRRHRDRVTRRDPFEVGKVGRRREPAFDELGGLPQRRCQLRIDPVHVSVYVSPAGGVHTT